MKTRYTKILSPRIVGLFGVLAITLMLVLAMVALPQTAYASAYGCNIKSGLTGPNSYCVYISGSSTYVSYVKGTYSGGAIIKNPYITAEFFDTNWRWYKTYKSSVTYGEVTGGTKSISIKQTMKPGYMCSTLHYSIARLGNKTMSVCHQIKR